MKGQPGGNDTASLSRKELHSIKREMHKLCRKKNCDELKQLLEEASHNIELENSFINTLKNKVSEIDPNKIYMYYVSGKLTEEQYSRISEHHKSLQEEIKKKEHMVLRLSAQKEHIESLIEKESPENKKLLKQKRKTHFWTAATAVVFVCFVFSGYQCYRLYQSNVSLTEQYKKEKDNASRYYTEKRVLKDSYDRLAANHNELKAACNKIIDDFVAEGGVINTSDEDRWAKYRTDSSELSWRDELDIKYGFNQSHSSELWEKLTAVVDTIKSDRDRYRDSYIDNSLNKKVKIGGSKQSVIDACGSPDKMVDTAEFYWYDNAIWYYGTSYVEFDEDGLVCAWHIGGTELPVE